MTQLETLLAERNCVVLDGGLATELHHMGIRMGAPRWSAQALITAEGRSATTEAHRDFLAAGANVITTNTFRTNPRALRTVGEGLDASAALTAQAVDLARAAVAAEGHGAIAASIAPVEDCYDPSAVPADAELEAEHDAFAQILGACGVRIALVETMNCVREAVIAARCARRYGMEPWVSFVCGGRAELLSGEPLRDAARAVAAAGATAVLLNCCDLAITRAALPALDDAPLAVGAYPNMEDRSEAESLTDGPLPVALEPDGFAAALSALQREHRLSLVGGCCGARPAHIGRLAAALHPVNQGVLT